MSMYPCSECKTNSWNFDKTKDGFVRATCKECKYEVEWLPKQGQLRGFTKRKEKPEDFPKFKKQGVLFFDGGLDLKAEKATWGYVLRIGSVQFADKGYILPATNNIGEQTALLRGLKFALEMNVSHLIVFGDSTLIINQAKGEWKCKKDHLKPGYKEIKNMVESFDQIVLQWVPREFNQEADFMTRNLSNNLQPGIYE